MVLGSRYLDGTTAGILVDTFLPPYRETGLEEAMRTPAGTPREDIIRQYGVEKVIVLPGDKAQENSQSLLDHGGPMPEALNRTTEVWLVPWRERGLSNFAVFWFDEDNRLIRVSQSHLIRGFQTDLPEGRY